MNYGQKKCILRVKIKNKGIIETMKIIKDYGLWLIKGGCILALLMLVVPLFQTEPMSNAPFDQVLQATIEGVDMSKYPQKDVLALKRYLDLDASMFEQIAFYRSENAMDADELVLAKFNTEEAKKSFLDAIQKRIESQTTTYEGYAPEQYDLMKKGKLISHANYGLYVVGPQAEQIASQFEKSL